MTPIFDILGFPECFVSDNGTQFSSHEYNTYVKARGTTIMHSPPYHPESNEQAMVRAFENLTFCW